MAVSGGRRRLRGVQDGRRFFRPLGSGAGAFSFGFGTTKNSVISTRNAREICSRSAMVGFSNPRSSRLTYVRSIPASTASASCETRRITRSRLMFRATRARAFIKNGRQLAAC